MTYDFTAQQVVEEVRAIAAERPDFVYTAQVVADGFVKGFAKGEDMCGYAGYRMKSTEGEGCIVGQALSRLGVNTNDLLRVDGDSASGAFKVLKGIAPYENVLDDADLLWLDCVQQGQDEGTPWGQAVAEADDSEDEEGV